MALAVIALLAGGLLAWSQSAGLRGGEPRLPSSNAGFGFWPGSLVYQTAYTLAFVLLLTAGTPWPLVGLILCLAALVVWWAGSLEAEELPHSRGSEWIARQVRPRWAVVQSYLAKQFSRLLRRKGTDHPGFPFSRYGKILLPSIALASLAGMPFTVGARGRWPYYAAWLKRGDPAVLVALAADVFFCAGLWTAFTMVLQPVGEHRPRPAPALATFVLVLGVVILGIAPGIVSDGLAAGGPQSASSGEPGYPSGGVSVWGLGFLYVLPWLLGAWLARMRRRLRDVPERLQTVVGLDWLYHALDWLGQRLLGALHWLSQVGEGEGWWGWALIVLALGVLLLAGA
jgi:hypothetical protein